MPRDPGSDSPIIERRLFWKTLHPVFHRHADNQRSRTRILSMMMETLNSSEAHAFYKLTDTPGPTQVGVVSASGDWKDILMTSRCLPPFAWSAAERPDRQTNGNLFAETLSHKEGESRDEETPRNAIQGDEEMHRERGLQEVSPNFVRRTAPAYSRDVYERHGGSSPFHKYNELKHRIERQKRMAKRGERRFNCENCDRTFIDAGDLQRHIRQHHIGARAHPCGECGKAFGTASGLKQHRHIHSSVKPFTCAVCHKAYTQYSNLCRHKRMHSDCRAQIKCRNCRQLFPNANSLNKHRRFCAAHSRASIGSNVVHHRPNGLLLPGIRGQAREMKWRSDPSPASNDAEPMADKVVPLAVAHVNFGSPTATQTPPFTPLIAGFPGAKLFPVSAPPNDLYPCRSAEAHIQSPRPVDKQVQCTNPGAESFLASFDRTKAVVSADGRRFRGATACASYGRHSVSHASVQVDLSGAKPSLDLPQELATPDSSAQVSDKQQHSRERIWNPLLSPSASQEKRNLLPHPNSAAEAVAAAILYRSTLEKRALSQTVANYPVLNSFDAPEKPLPTVETQISTCQPLDLSLPKKSSAINTAPKSNPSSWENPLNFYYQFGKRYGSTSILANQHSRQISANNSPLSKLAAIPWYFRQPYDAFYPSLKARLPAFNGVLAHQPSLLPSASPIFDGATTGAIAGPSLKATPPSKERYTCRYCQKVFPRSANLTRHERTHTGEQPYTCKFCERSFSISSNLQRHIRNIHKKERPYPCHLCGRAFGQQTNLDRHLRNHEKYSSVNDGHYQFTSDASRELAQHRRATSTAVKSQSLAPFETADLLRRMSNSSMDSSFSSATGQSRNSSLNESSHRQDERLSSGESEYDSCYVTSANSSPVGSSSSEWPLRGVRQSASGQHTAAIQG